MTFVKCLEVFRSRSDQVPIVDTLKKLGYTMQQQGKINESAQYFSKCIELAKQIGYQQQIAHALAGLASVAQSAGAYEHAALLFGAVEARLETVRGLDPDELMFHKHDIAALRQRLDPTTLEMRWAEGRTLEWEQAMDEALAFIEGVD